MKKQENFNNPAIGFEACNEWTAPEIKILDSGNAEFLAGPIADGGDMTLS
jgi:hypothetical protein